MSRSRKSAPPPSETSGEPPCYALVHPGLEAIAADEIQRDLQGEVKLVRGAGRGLVVFRLPEIDASVLSLRTTEDVFLLGWGTDQLTHRATDLEKIRQWTATEPDWKRLLEIHHAIRPKPKGRPTYRLVTQMSGKHAYRRADAGKALVRGLTGKIPASWKEADENASLEVWLSIHGKTAVCGVRLSDRTMRHRSYKHEHLPASLRPTLAAAMVRLAGARHGQVVLDPMCGAGTLLAEQLALAEARRMSVPVWGGDCEWLAIWSASANLRKRGQVELVRWDARRLPLPGECVDHILSNPPFGKQLSTPEQLAPLYRAALREQNRVLRPGGQAVLLVMEIDPLREATGRVGWESVRQVPIRILGQSAVITVWRKPGG